MNDLSEKEQLEEMRVWWTENGRFVITGLVLGIAIIFGWNQWKSSITTTRMEASALFEQVMDAVQSGDIDAANVSANAMFADYGQTVYPAQTRLAMARLYMDKGRDEDAAEMLRELLRPDENSEVQLVGRLRLGRILMYQNNPDAVVELLRDIEAGGFAARYNEVLGDAYAVQGNIAEAQAAYMAAMAANTAPQTIDSNLVQLKLNDLPDAAELAAASAAMEAAIDAGETAELTGETAPDPEETASDPAEAAIPDDSAPANESADADTGDTETETGQ